MIERKTMIFDIICLISFLIIGLFFFNTSISLILPIKISIFAICIAAIIYFGIYRNHNYTKDAFIYQGELDIKKGRIVSNLDVLEQIIIPNTEKEIEND